ncbi:MAG: DUF805 domain-containing protein [Pseudomonadota bacterium]
MNASIQAISTCLSKYVTFSGRARRPEYWWFFLFVVIGGVVFSVLDSVFFGGQSEDGIVSQPLYSLFSILVFLPLLAAGWRRLHDTGRPGWYLLLPLAVSLAMTVGLLLSIFAFSATGNASGDPNELGASVAILGLGGMAAAFIVQLVVAILMIYWLSRPTQQEENRYGPVPLEP